MKAIILAAWQWTRLRPITNTIPKPMIEVLGKTILDYNLENIYEYVDEIIIIVKYLKEIIIEWIWDNYRWVKVTYIEQWEEKWTAWALKWINCNDDVLILYWDSILDKSDIEKVIKLKNYGWLVKEVSEPQKYWIYKVDEKWFALEIVEKPEEYIWNLANLWWFKFSSEIFEYLNNISLSKRWEYELTDALNLFLENNKFELIKIEWDFIDIGYPEDIEKAENILKEKLLKKPGFWTSVHLKKIWEYDLYLWMDEKYFEKLIKNSTDLEDIALQENTSDLKRFSTKEKFEKWYNDDKRYLFVLTNWNNLAWIWWWRPAKLPEIKKIINEEIAQEVIKNEKDSHTSWIRIYKDFRWKGLAKVILQNSTSFYRKIFPNAYTCIDIDKANIPSQKAYEKWWYIFFWLWENKKTVEAVEEPRLLYVELPKKWD